ncbi:MAG: hypothetical protein CMJ95_05205, partial [Planctomycetes bacterium]|nr:hypothetical protein [Planctomycetota bacterium]
MSTLLAATEGDSKDLIGSDRGKGCLMSRFHAGNLMVWIITVVMSFASSECLGQEFTLKAGNAEVLASGSVDVPIYIDVNTGVGASTIDFGITYRGFLTLTSISEGSALTGLNGGAGAFQFLPDTADDGTPTTPSGAGTGLKGASLSVIIPDLSDPSPDFLTMGADQEIAVLHFTDGSDKPSAISDTEFTNSLSGGLGAVVIEITDDNTTTPGTYNTPAGVALVNGEVLVTTPPVTGFTCMQTDPCACTVSLDWTNGYLYDTLSLYKDSVDPANLIDTFLPSGGVLAESYVLTQTNPTTYILVGRSNGVDSAETSCTEMSDCTDPDSTPPVINGTPADMPGLKTDGGLCTTTVSWTDPTATDNCPPDPTPSYEVTEGGTADPSLTNGGTWPAGTYVVTFSAMDINGNSATSTSFTVTISDNEAPEILDTPDDQFAYKTDGGLCTTTVSWTDPTATDNCSPVPTPTYEVIEVVGGTTVALTNGGSWSAGIYLVTFNATDVNGNDAGSTSFNVTVSDNEDPEISGMPANITEKNDDGSCDAVVSWTEPTDSDNCPGQGLSSTHNPGATFPVGSATTVTYTSTDASGNSVTDSFTVTINDNEDPSDITGMPLDITQKNDAGNCDAVVTWTEMPSADDNCAGTIAATADMPSGSTFSLGDTIVTYTATDAAGNMSTATFTVTINDNEDPSDITGMPLDITQKNDA